MEWLDPAGKSPRRRVRIVKADFKYPLLRRIEEVSVDPETGEERIGLVSASVADHVLVGLKHGVDEAEARKVIQRNGHVVRGAEPGSFLLVEVVAPGEIDAQEKAIRALVALDNYIDFSEPDYLVWPTAEPNDPDYAAGRLWGLDNPGTIAGTTLDADIDAPEGWDARTDASTVVVAVVDTGIRYTHEDLSSNMWTNTGETPGDGLDNDQNGVIDDVHGFDAQHNDGSPADDNGHGTHVAGTIGAQGNNGIGVTGVAWDVQLMGVKFLSGAGGTTSDAIRSVNYARMNGAHVINASWGGGGYSVGLYNAIKACGEAGILFVAAAGNDGSDNDATPHYPSSYELPNVVAVASTTRLDDISTFSNTGQFSVDLAAPGSDIRSAFYRSDADYKSLNGTSMAAPHVSGALALAAAEFPGEDAIDLRSRLFSSVDAVDALRGEMATGGRLNLHRLLTASSALSAHDQFADAYRFEGSYGFWSGSNRRGTREPDEDDFSQPLTGIRSLWFAWQAPFAGLAEIKVTSERGAVRTILYRGGMKDSLDVIDEGRAVVGGDGRFFVYVEAGQEYRLLTDSFSTSGQNLTVAVDLLAANDNLGRAEVIAGSSFSVVGNNRRATAEPFEFARPHGGVGQGHSVWWTWTPDSDGEYTLTTKGSKFDTVLAVYAGDPAIPSGFSEVASNDDRTSFDWTSEVTVGVVAGTSYHIVVDSYRKERWGEVLLNGYEAGRLIFLDDLEPVQARPGQRAVLEVSVTGEDVSFEWFENGWAIPFERRSRLGFDRVVGEDAGTYHVVARRGSEEIRSQDAELTVVDSPPKIVWRSPDQAVAIDSDLTLRVVAFGSGTLTYQWYHESLPIPDATDATLTILGLQQSDTGFYTVVIENSQGSATTPEIQVRAQERPWGTWTWVRPRPFSEDIAAMEFLNNRFIGLSTGSISISLDGVNWRHVPLPNQGHTVRSAAYGNGVYVFGTEGLGMRIVSSFDLASFTETTTASPGSSGSVEEVEFGAGIFVARTRYALFVSNDGYIRLSQLAEMLSAQCFMG
jgi:subtilisin family serine protease